MHADMYQTLRGVLQDFLRLLSVVQKKHLPVAKRQPVQHEILMKVRNALIIVGLATVATASFAGSAYHASPVQEQGAVFTPDHLGKKLLLAGLLGTQAQIKAALLHGREIAIAC